MMDRREAIRRVTVVLGGVALVGGDALVAACTRERPRQDEPIGEFTPDDIAFLDEVAETILPETSTPGAKAARTGAFIALMVTDTYDARDRQVFRDGMRKLDELSRQTNQVPFMAATPQQRLAVVERLDREQKSYMDAREASRRERDKEAEEKQPEAYLPDQRKEAGPTPDVTAAAAITADAPPHHFRMMKELTLLGYFTSEIGCKQAQRYIEAPGRFDPCVPYTAGERSWAGHA